MRLAPLLAALLCAITWGIFAVHALSPRAFATELSAHSFLPSIASNVGGPFCDTFDELATGWITGQHGDLWAEVSDGEYSLAFSGAGTVWLVPGPVCEHSAYRAAVDTRWVGDPGNFAGLLFNLDDRTQNGYMFAINTNDRVWLVFEIVGNSLGTVISPVGNDAILSGLAVNRLAVEREDQTIRLLINDTPVGELRDSQPGKPLIVGVAAASYTTQQYAEARFDNFQFEEIVRQVDLVNPPSYHRDAGSSPPAMSGIYPLPDAHQSSQINQPSDPGLPSPPPGPSAVAVAR